ncbi:MAG: MFS transporter [Candidatus Sericytochromatia bacterium]|nr:MFS transporter [Candidatus Sericytochromatia bacterium]
MDKTIDSREVNEPDFTNKWYIMASVAMGVFLATIDGSIVNITLPTLVRELKTNFATVQWIVLSYLLVVTTSVISVGRLADMFKKKTIYLSGYIVFTLSSVLCGFAWNVESLIAFRIIQAVGAAMIMGLGTAIVTESFPAKERGKALGVIGSIVSLGVVTGPLLGGIILSKLTWHWVFFVNLPVGIIGSLMVLKYIPSIPGLGRQKFDFVGAITLFLGLASLLLALTTSQVKNLPIFAPFLLFISAIIFLSIFFITERKIAQPLLDLKLFNNKVFSINLISGFTTFVATSGSILLMPFYLENVLGYSTRTVGMLLGVVPVALGITAPISGSLSDKFGSRKISMLGLILILGGYTAVSTLDQNSTMLGYIFRFLPIGIGMGLFQSPNNSAIMGSVNKNQLGIASGLLSSTRTLGQIMGNATLGTLWAHLVIFYSSAQFSDNLTKAPIQAQVTALHNTFHFVIGLIAISLILSFYGLYNENKVIKLAQKPI